MTHRVESQSLSTEVKTEDVLTALSAFPAPPNYIPASPSVSNGGGSYFSLPRERHVPPSSFARSKGTLTRRDSEQSVESTNSGKLSVRVNGRDVELARKDSRQRNRDSGSGSSGCSSLGVNSSSTAVLPSPMSGRSYYTAPNSPFPSGTPGAGPSSASHGAGAGVRMRSSSSSLTTPSSAYPASTSSASAYPYSSPSSAYPNSPANGTRYVYPNPSTSARTALSLLSNTSTSSSPSSAHVPISAVGMPPIVERAQRERNRERSSQATRRQSSVPPSSGRRETRRGRSKTESESGSEIGGPPSVPLPPLPSAPKVESADATPRGGPPSIKSLPSLRSGRKSTSSPSQTHDGHLGKRESGVSFISTGNGVSAFSAAAPNLAELGVVMRKGEVDTQGNGKEPAGDRPKSRARVTRAAAIPLKIDIPPTPTQEIHHPLGSGSSLTSPLPRELGGSRSLKERAADGNDRVQSPTGSLFSIASGVTTRSSGMSTAQCLRTRVSGILEGLGHIPSISPSATTPLRTSPSPYTSGGGSDIGGPGEGEEERTRRLHIAVSSKLHPSTNPVKMSRRASMSASDSNGLLTIEDLTRDPMATRAMSPIAPGNNGRAAPSPSPVDLGRRLRSREDATAVPSITHVPPLSDIETETEENDKTDGEPRASSESLLSQFPSIPARSRPPPSSFPFLSSGSHNAPGRSSGSASGSTINGVYRTMSQSRRKPLPPAPRALRESLSSVVSRETASLADEAIDAIRGRGQGVRNAARDGGTSPDIDTMMKQTPRSGLRSKSLSARSSRSSKSLSTRSSSIKSTTRDRNIRPSLPDESERQRAISRFSAVSSSSSRNSGLTREGLPTRRSAGSEFTDAYGGIEEDVDATVDYGVAIARHRGAYDLSPSPSNVDEFGLLHEGHDDRDFYAEEAEAMLNDASVNGSPEEEESDSDIDLHTPLPHILLREGVLSPQSKVIASMSSGSLSTRSSFIDTGRDSVASYVTNASFGSVMTKSGLFKDERDTDKRRRRHRDGKLLKEGLGLTTGLGWSDSEDEDAPSPFTNRVKSMTLSRNTSMASLRSQSSKSQFFSRSTPSSEATSRILSTLSERPPMPPSLASRGPLRKSEPHPLSKSYSSVNRGGSEVQGKQKRSMTNDNERRSMSPTSSSATSIPFPPTPRDDLHDSSEENLPSGVSDRSRTASRASSGGARTPTAGSLRPKQSTSSLRAPSVKSVRSAPASRPGLTGPSTPRPLRLPALQQQKTLSGDDSKLQPGQPDPGTGAILGYNRNLHDRQRAHGLSAPKSAPAHGRASPMGLLSPTLSQKSAPSSSTSSARRAYGSMPASSSLHPPSTSIRSARLREPSPSRLSTPATGLGKPRTGTGMVYRQSSMPVGTAI